MYHYLTDSKDQPRDLAWLCTLYQSCSQFIKEQKSQYDHLMKMARTCSNKAHKSGFPADFRLRNFFSVKSWLTVSWAPLWDLVSPNPDRISPSPNWQCCSTPVALQVCCYYLPLTRARLRDLRRWIGGVNRAIGPRFSRFRKRSVNVMPTGSEAGHRMACMPN